jgi:hypothetical protein
MNDDAGHSEEAAAWTADTRLAIGGGSRTILKQSQAKSSRPTRQWAGRFRGFECYGDSLTANAPFGFAPAYPAVRTCAREVHGDGERDAFCRIGGAEARSDRGDSGVTPNIVQRRCVMGPQRPSRIGRDVFYQDTRATAFEEFNRTEHMLLSLRYDTQIVWRGF